MIVPAGGLSTDRAEWLSTPANFLMPVKILSKVFRGILCQMIKKQWDNGALIIPEKWIDALLIFSPLKVACLQIFQLPSGASI